MGTETQTERETNEPSTAAQPELRLKAAGLLDYLANNKTMNPFT